MRALLVAALLFAAPAAAQMTQDQTAEAAAPLLERLARAETELQSRPLENELWQLWSNGPDADATAALEEGRRRIRAYDLDGALAVLEPLTLAAPGFAEAWNQKAFAHFLKFEFDEALEDLDRTLEIEPRHFGALSGRALTLMRQGRMQLGQTALRDALKVHPFLPERALLIEPSGEEI